MSGVTMRAPEDYSDSYSNSQDDAAREHFFENRQYLQQQQAPEAAATAATIVSRMLSIGFQGYTVDTTQPFTGFHHIVIAYCIMAFVLMYPFVVCGHHLRESRKRQKEVAVQKQTTKEQQQPQQSTKEPQQQQEDADLMSPPVSEIVPSMESIGEPKLSQQHQQEGGSGAIVSVSIPVAPESAAGGVPLCQKGGDININGDNQEPIIVTPTTTKSTFQDDADRPLSNTVLVPPVSVGIADSPESLMHPHPVPVVPVQTLSSRSRLHSQIASSSGILSRNPSAATTGRLYSSSGQARRAPSAAWPRHKHSRRPSGDPSWQWRRAIQTERRHRSRRIEQLSSQYGLNGTGSQLSSTNNNNNSNMLFRIKSGAAGMMSDLANSVLSAEQQQQQQQQQSQSQRHNPQKGSHQYPSKRQHQLSYPPLTRSGVEPFSGVEAPLYSRQAMAMRQRQAKLQQQQHHLHPQIQVPHPHHSGRMSRRPSHSGSARSGSVSLRSHNGYQSSVMSSIVDDISPNDAADADDPGKVRTFPTSAGIMAGNGRTPCGTACCAAMEPWLDVAEPDEEWKRLMGLALPMTLGAILEPLSRCILVGILSQRVGTHAMVAYLLVQLLYRLSGEILSIAITDAESTLVQTALTASAAANNDQQQQEANSPGNSSFTKEGYRLAGQYVQLSCWFQLILITTVLLLWYFWIEDVILWWVDSPEIASLAKDYFEIILVLFLVQAIYRAIVVPCHMRGSEHSKLETIMDLFVTTATLITAAVVLAKTTEIPGEYEQQELIGENSYTPKDRLADSRTALITVAWIQVNIGVAACVLKVAFCIIKGWLDHFWGGLLRSIAVLNFRAMCNLLLTSIPLMIGAFLELREVDLLTLFVQHLGKAEVATWAILGSIWDVLEASTEGISEASAIRVAYHLSASHPAVAKKLAHKALFWTVVGSLTLTSILLLAGRNLIVALTVDYTLQHLLDDLLGLMALANLSMAFAQVCWSLLGAQGRFNLATMVMLVCRWCVTMPLALIFIFAMHYDEETLAGAVAVGYSTAASVLASILFSSDWHDVAQELFLQGLLTCDDDDDFDFSFGDDDESSDDDDSFGVGASGYPSNKKSLDNDEAFDLPQSTDPTTRTGTNTGSGINSGVGSGLHSGGTISGVSGS